VENEPHRRICAGTIALPDAQREIASNWLVLWNRGVAGSADEVGDSSLDDAGTTTSATNTSAPAITTPPAAGNVPGGATAHCQDGTFSFSQTRAGTCAQHSRVAQWLS
jgi:hypothetical protein